MKPLYYILISLLFFACRQNPDVKNAQGAWITGTEEEKLNLTEKHFRGFDLAMVETGYRFEELYWAGQDENWDYAQYQLDKIKIAIENGLERRPKRAESAADFLNTIIPEVSNGIHSKDTSIFNQNFQLLITGCNNCHRKEKVPFFNVLKPSVRKSIIKK